jgi:N-acetylglucosaminyldiphosphoundecaprenol N-acetyl-beta-D-mannosaminyltransferase
VRLAGKLFNRNIRQNVNGTDLFPELCAAAEKMGLSFYLLGGRAGIAERVAEWMTARHPRLRVAGWRDGYFSSGELPSVLAGIRASRAEILLVAMGAPTQEKWLRQNLPDTGARLGIGVGGLFDFYSGRMPRAPIWMREIGMEWVYRFLQEPERMWRRYLVGNAVFLARVLWPGSRRPRTL